MRASDPVVLFLLVLAIGVVAGILFDRLAGPSWLARQFSGSSRGIVTSVLVGVAGAFVGYHIAALCARRRANHFGHRRGGGCRRGAVRLANGEVTESQLRYPRFAPGLLQIKAGPARYVDLGSPITHPGHNETAISNLTS